MPFPKLNPSHETDAWVYPLKALKPLHHGIDLYPFFFQLWRYKIFIICCISSCVVLGYILTKSMTPRYRAKTTIMLTNPYKKPVPQTEQEQENPIDERDLLQEYGFAKGTLSALLLLNSRSIYIDTIQSLNLLPALTEASGFSFLPIPSTPLSLEKAYLKLKSFTVIQRTQKKGDIITITVQWPGSPKLPAQVANQLRIELQKRFQAYQATQTSSELSYLASTSQRVREEIFTLKNEIFFIQQKHQFYAPLNYTKDLVASLAQLKEQLVAQNLKLQLTSTYDVNRPYLENEIQLLKEEIFQIEQGNLEGVSQSVPIPLTKLPAIQLELKHLENQVATKQKQLQYLLSKLDIIQAQHDKDSQQIRLIDPAYDARSAYAPRAKKNYILSFALGVLIALGSVWCWVYLPSILRKQYQEYRYGEYRS